MIFPSLNYFSYRFCHLLCSFYNSFFHFLGNIFIFLSSLSLVHLHWNNLFHCFFSRPPSSPAHPPSPTIGSNDFLFLQNVFLCQPYLPSMHILSNILLWLFCWIFLLFFLGLCHFSDFSPYILFYHNFIICCLFYFLLDLSSPFILV